MAVMCHRSHRWKHLQLRFLSRQHHASGSSELVVSHSFNTTTERTDGQHHQGETLVVNVLTGSYSYTATGTPPIAPEVNVAPEVSLGVNGSLLGLIGVEALGLIDFSTQQAFAARMPTTTSMRFRSFSIR